MSLERAGGGGAALLLLLLGRRRRGPRPIVHRGRARGLRRGAGRLGCRANVGAHVGAHVREGHLQCHTILVRQGLLQRASYGSRIPMHMVFSADHA